MRNPRHLLGSAMQLIVAILLVAACGASTSTADVATNEPDADSDSPLDDELSDPAPDATTSGTATRAETDSHVDAERPVESGAEASLTPGVGLMVATGADIVVFVDGVAHAPFPLRTDPPVVTAVDGDGTGGLVLGTDAGLFWVGVDAQRTLTGPIDDAVPTLLDVADSSLGTIALALWSADGTQQLGGFRLDAPGEPTFVIEVSNAAWTTTHAALSGDDTDRILLSGSAGGCLGVAAVDFTGQPVDVANLPMLTAAATDPGATTDVCSDREALTAAWGPDGIVVVAEAGIGGRPARITAFDTRSTDADAWFVVSEPTVGPSTPDFLDIDLTPNGTTTAVLAQRTGYDAVRFDPAQLFVSDAPFFPAPEFGNAADAQMITLAPEFDSAFAVSLEELEMIALEEASAGPTEVSCGLTAVGDDVVAIDLQGDGAPELWSFGEADAAGVRSAYVMHGEGDPAACEEAGALVGDQQLVFSSSSSATSPAGWYCVGDGPYEIVQWFGDAGSGAADASVELQRHTPPDAGTVWSRPITETITGLDTPVPPELAASTCPLSMQP